MALSTFVICQLIFVALLPPLTQDERDVLNGVQDDGAFVQSAALDVLVNHVLSWSADSVDPDALSPPRFSTMLSDPGQFRGDPFEIEGQLVRRDKRPLGRTDLEAWIIIPSIDRSEEQRRPDSIAVLVPTSSFESGSYEELPVAIRIPARFFARLTVPSHSDPERKMPLLLFVGSHPTPISTLESGSIQPNAQPVTLIVIFVIVLGILFIGIRYALRLKARRASSAMPVARYDDNDGRWSEGDTDLPAEPAEALEVLRKRAGDSCNRL